MTKSANTATALVSASPVADDPKEMWDDMFEAPASTRPSLELIESPEFPAEEPPTQKTVAPDVAPLVHTCSGCGAQVADMAGVWNEELGLCKTCAAPELRKQEAAARKAAKTCRCGGEKERHHKVCPDCHKKAKAEAEAARRTCPKCGGEKERHHKVCPDCYRNGRPQRPAAKRNEKPTRPGTPEYKVDPKAQAKAAARTKLGQALLAAHRTDVLQEKFPGAKVTKDEAGNAQVCIAYKGESYTLVDQAKVKDIAELKAMKAKADALAKAEAAKKAAEQRKAAAAAAKANKSKQPKKGKKDKSGDAKPTKAERKAERKGK